MMSDNYTYQHVHTVTHVPFKTLYRLRVRCGLGHHQLTYGQAIMMVFVCTARLSVTPALARVIQQCARALDADTDMRAFIGITTRNGQHAMYHGDALPSARHMDAVTYAYVPALALALSDAAHAVVQPHV